MKTQRIVIAAIFALGAGHAAMAEESSYPETLRTGSNLTRAEVLADLQIYRESGLAEFDRGESHDTTTAAYAGAQAKYAQLRASSHYATLVQHIAARRGEAVAS